MYLFDTDTLSMSLRRTPPLALLAKMASVPRNQWSTSSITLGELLYGAHRVTQQQPSLLQRIETLLLPNLPILAFDEAAARRYGVLRAQLERQGMPLADPDLRI